jgi:uncharacterized protein YndB with AHSA1/START domain
VLQQQPWSQQLKVNDAKRSRGVEHATLVFEREIPAPLEKVFEAFADASHRAQWGAPSDTAIIVFDEVNFAEGGRELFRCGAKSNPNIHGTTGYLEIVPNVRVVSCETIVVDGRRLCASLTTLEISANGTGTSLKSTTQIASFVGQDMIEGHEVGNNASLDSLVRYLT